MTTEAQQLSPKASQPVRESENGVLGPHEQEETLSVLSEMVQA